MKTATKRRARLGDLLTARGVITHEQLACGLAAQQDGQQDRLLGEILVDLGYATQEQVLSAVAAACGVPFARLTSQLVDPVVRTALPAAFIQKHGVLPLFRVRDVLTVAVSEPSNIFLIDEIAHAAGLGVQVVAAAADNIYQMLDETPTDANGPTQLPDDAFDELPMSADLLLPDDYESVYGAWPAEKVAGLLIREAVRARASAIHLEPDEKVLRIRFRIDGLLHVVMRPPVRLAGGLVAAFEEMMGSAGKPSPLPGLRRSARLLVQGCGVQLEVVSLTGAFGPRTVVRLVRDDEARKPLEKIGCDAELLSAYRGLLAEGRGLVVVAGPRESGVTTTLYGTLDALDPVRLNVCTMESCVHFSLPGVNQFSPATCGTADLSDIFHRLLLQQPDVLVLDGVIDAEVVPAAVEAALDGCLVLACIPARDAADAIARLAADVPAELLASALRGVLAQRLVRTVCLHCHTPYDPPASLRRRVAKAFGPVTDYVKGRGCPGCKQTGFLGQIGLFDLTPVDAGLADLIRTGADVETLRDAIRSAGRPSIWNDALSKIRAGVTSAEEVMDVLAGYPGGVPSHAAAPQSGTEPA
ncbi:MAG TPA: ATPase, T2SS/T4P/T4SS family [Phycisphaerae bacterium]|nr:ATPase, T2SS/T4P/T4SS family [Phycisphaerae bacterium]